MMATRRVFVVTGANKGIGYGIVKGLAEKVSDSVIYLTARNDTFGNESLEKIKSELGSKCKSEVRFHQLDITKKDTIEKFASYLKKEHNGFDVLINNAGFAFKHAATEPPEEQARVTIGVNYEGTKQVSNILIPLLRDGGRIVNVCSQAGLLVTSWYSQEIVGILTNPTVTVADVDKFTEGYIRACVENNRREKGYPESAYCVSKAAEITLSLIQSRELKSRNIIVNACCPGYVNTDMTSHKGTLTIEEGADTPIYLATFDGNEPNGKFVYLRKPIEWVTSKAPF